jgi:nucleotide-binding universal stress UspA family protein
MPYKEILVSLDASDTGRRRRRFAIALSCRFRAHVIGYYLTPTVAGPEWRKSEQVNSDMAPDELAASIEQEFEEELRASGLDGRWMLSSDPLLRLIEEIRYVDLAVLGLGDPGRFEPDPQGFSLGDVVTACGRPVLGAPVGVLPETCGKNVLLAWDGSREATRALHDAIPLMENAESVKVVSIGSGGNVTGVAERTVLHLARYGIAAAADNTPLLNLDIGSELLNRAATLNVDLIVAGAYGHSKVAESIFGGASKSLLHQMLVPVLLSH